MQQNLSKYANRGRRIVHICSGPLDKVSVPMSPIGVPVTPVEAQSQTGIAPAGAMLELARSQELGRREGSSSPTSDSLDAWHAMPVIGPAWSSNPARGNPAWVPRSP